jgi:hypothetical protein
MAISHPKDWRRGTSQWVIAEALVRHDFNRKKAFAIDVRPNVGTDPLIFRDNAGMALVNADGSPSDTAFRRAWYRTGDVLKAIRQHGWDPDQAPDEAPEEAPEAPSSVTDLIPQDLPAEVTPIRPVRSDLESEVERYYAGIQHRRAFVRGRKGVESLDSMRIVIDGIKAIIAGIPADALFAAIEAPWTELTREQCAAFRPASADLKPQAADGFDYAGFAPRPSEFAHAVSGYVDAAISAGLLVWLHGPAGTGKSSAAKYAAKRHAERCGLTGEKTGGRTYFEVNCAGAMVSAVKGRDKLHSTVITDFMLAYEHGGTVNLEEFDSSHPSVGTFLGTALAATDGFVNDMLERWVPRHKDFRCIVTANSLGYGSPEFKRQDLDAATKDRFRAGRVFTGLDLTLERSIINSLVSSALRGALVAA